MLLAQARIASEVFFPPWYFWLFVLAVVVVVFAAIVTIVFLTLSAETERRRHDRETAARLIEVMALQRKMSPQEIEQVLNSYWQLGTFWHRFSRWFARRKDEPQTGLVTKAQKFESF